MQTGHGAWSHLLFSLTVIAWSSSLYLWVQGTVPAAGLCACLTGVLLTLYFIVQEKGRMFRRRNRADNQNDEELPLSDAMASPEILPGGTVHSTLATGVHIRGDICVSGVFFVGGQVTGDITAPEGTVVVNGGGSVEGNITCQRLEVNGEIRGMCTAGNAEIGATGSVTGGLRYGSLTVHPGGGLCGEISQQAPPSDGAVLPEKLVQRKDTRKTSPAVDSGDDSGQ